MHGAVIECLKNLREGVVPTGHPTLEESDGFCGALPLVALLASQDAFVPEPVEHAVRVLTNSVGAVAHAMTAARIVHLHIQGVPDPIASLRSDPSVPDAIKEEVGAVVESISEPHTPVVARFGKACGYPGSLKGGLHAILTSSSYTEAVRKVIKAGGCNCSRNNFVGACLGAKYGIDAIPMQWMLSTNKGLDVLNMALQLVTYQRRTGL
jgi:ADP-ribosylglycohydrolase